MSKAKKKQKSFYNSTPLDEQAILTPLSKEEAEFICNYNPTNIPYDSLDFSQFKEKYAKENVLTKEQILEFSKEEILTEGEKQFLRDEKYIIAGEIFEFSGIDLIAAEIDPKTLKFKR
jgi:hypothetical protein